MTQTSPCSDLTAPQNNDLNASQVLVAVPTLNEARNIRDCLNSLLNDPWVHDAQIVVADAGSTDDTCDIVQEMMIKHPNLRITHNPRRLQSAAVNAVAAEHGDDDTRILVRCDAHSVYPAGYIREVASALIARPDAASLVTPMDSVGETCFGKAAAWIVDTPVGSGGSAHRGGRQSHWVEHGHHAGFRLDWFRKVDGYDPDFSHNEDAELDHRLTLAGGKIWLDATIRLDYKMRATPGGLRRQYWLYGRGRARTISKHKIRPKLRQVIPAVNFVVIALSLVCGLFVPTLLWLPIAYLCVLAGISAFCAAKMGWVCGLWAGVALAIMHNSWGAGFVWQLLTKGKTA